MNNKLLSICIPTFNGNEFLHDLLTSLVISLNPTTFADVEIIVSDNNLDQDLRLGVRRIITEYTGSLPIKLIVNDHKHLKLDGNLLNLINHARGEFVWFMCDDDAVATNAVSKVLDSLKVCASDQSVIFANYHTCDAKLNVLDLQTSPNIIEGGAFTDCNDFLYATALKFGLVSSIIVRRKGAMDCELEQYIGQDSLHIPMLLQLAAKNGGYVIKEKLILMRDNNSRWGAGSDQILIISRLFGLMGAIHKLQYNKTTIRWMQKYFFVSILRTILRCHLRGDFDKNEVRLNLQKLYRDRPIMKFVISVALHAPKSLVHSFNKQIKKRIKWVN